jgi:hypothetical protein
MLITRELALLHTLQSKRALRRDWVAVGHLQLLIDRISGGSCASDDDQSGDRLEFVVH